MTGAGESRWRVAFALGSASGGTVAHVMTLADGCRAAGADVMVFGPAETLMRLPTGIDSLPVEIGDRPRPSRDTAAVARLRAQAAVALLDAMPEGVTRRVDVADKLGLVGPRRAALVELGLLVMDAGGSEERVAAVRSLLSQLPGAREGAEAVYVGDERAAFKSRAPVVCTGDASGALGEVRTVLQNDIGAEVPQFSGDIVAAHHVECAHATRLGEHDHMAPDRGVGDVLDNPIARR